MANDEHADAPAVTPRRQALIHELTLRLGPVCPQWPEELFNAMVERLADITLRYEPHASASMYDRRSTDRMVDELRTALERSKDVREHPKAK